MIKRNISRTLLSLSVLLISSLFWVSASALSGDSVIPTDSMNAFLGEYRQALKNGDTYVSMSDYGIYDDSAGRAYAELFTMLSINNGEYGSFTFGKYSETYVTNDFDTDPSSGYFTGVHLKYPERYMKDGKLDLSRIEADKKLVSDRYRYAQSLVKRGMSDTDKALILHDFIVCAADYPDPIGYDDSGFEIYDDDTYKVTGLLRDGYAVCSAYAKLYAMLLNDASVPAVTVYCDSINHEWVMIKIDDEWFHADPTWDDELFEYSETAFGRPNNDQWDIGAVSHYYFLKSDEEFEERDHPSWNVSYTVNPDLITKAPESGESGSFDDMFFSSDNDEYRCLTAMNNINGSWYFTDYKAGALFRVLSDGTSEIIAFPDDDIPMYSFGYENDLYISTPHKLYRYDTVGDKLELIMQLTGKGEKYSEYTEMGMRFGTMTLIKAEYNSDTDISFTIDTYPAEELRTMVPSEVIAEEKPNAAQKSEVSDDSGSKGRLSIPNDIRAKATDSNNDTSYQQNEQTSVQPRNNWAVITPIAVMIVLSVLVFIFKRMRK